MDSTPEPTTRTPNIPVPPEPGVDGSVPPTPGFFGACPSMPTQLVTDNVVWDNAESGVFFDERSARR